MTGSVTRRAPDFSGYPDLVVMMLGMHVRTWFGLRTLLGFRKPIELAGAARPEGLLHYEHRVQPFVNARRNALVLAQHGQRASRTGRGGAIS
jgi:hypothetical protein